MRALAASTSMRIYDEGRTSRRTIADAVEVLRALPGFRGSTCATIRACPLLLPTGNVTSLIQVVCEEVGWAVSLPTSIYFRGTSALDRSRALYDTTRLNGAIVDAECNVELAEGRYLYNVEVIPTRMPLKVTDTQWRILKHTIEFMHSKDQCYRNIDEGLLLPKYLDFGKLRGLTPFRLEALVRYIREADPVLRNISRQAVANTLRICGMRPPCSIRQQR